MSGDLRLAKGRSLPENAAMIDQRDSTLNRPVVNSMEETRI